MKHISVTLHFGRHLAFPKSIRLGWKNLLGTDTLAYEEHLSKLKFTYDWAKEYPIGLL